MMEGYNIFDYLCAFCCAVMAEMGDLLNMSYQKVNVYLFCWVEPGLCVAIWLLLLLIWLGLPGKRILAWAGIILTTVVVVAVIVLLAASLIRVIGHAEELMADPALAFNMNEPDPAIVNRFDNTVKVLSKTAKWWGLTYGAVNIIYYMLLLPVGILIECVKLFKYIRIN